jgi:hypothetical protein
MGKERTEVRFEMGIWQEVAFVMPLLEPGPWQIYSICFDHPLSSMVNPNPHGYGIKRAFFL